MWIFSRHGFYSITQSAQDPTVMQIRARERRDLEGLLELTGVEAEIIETPHADYRYRIVLPPVAAAGVVMQLASDITYSNFKGAVERTPSQAHKGPGLHRIWAIHHGWQTAERDQAGRG